MGLRGRSQSSPRRRGNEPDRGHENRGYMTPPETESNIPAIHVARSHEKSYQKMCAKNPVVRQRARDMQNEKKSATRRPRPFFSQLFTVTRN
jgi:hypothetical protein